MDSSHSPHGQLRRAVGPMLAVFLVVAAFWWLFEFLTPAVRSGPAGSTTICLNNVRNIGLAMRTYAEGNGGWLPPAYVADTAGRPLHSWRAVIAGYITNAAFARKYRWNEPWNSAGNLQLAKEYPTSDFHCPDDQADGAQTSYVVVVGPHTLFPGHESRKLNEITRPGGPSETLLVIELPQSGIHWMQPQDLTYDDAIRGNSTSSRAKIASVHTSGTIAVCFADGHAERIPVDELPAVLAKHLRIDDDSPHARR